MRKNTISIILLSFLSVCLQGFAQEYLPIPDSNAKWIMVNGDGWGGDDYTDLELADFKDDTLINSLEYIKITQRYLGGGGYYVGAFRNGDPGKAYYVPRDSINEYTLFDFTANTGDTVENVAYHFEGWGGEFDDVYDFIVDSTGYVQCGPYNLKYLYLHTDAVFPPEVEGPLIWVEKIGCLQGGIFNSMSHVFLSNHIWCMHYNDTVYYHGTPWGIGYFVYLNDSCVNPQHVNIPENNLYDISFSPNPFHNALHIVGLPQLPDMKLSIYDLSGKKLFQKGLSLEDNSRLIITDLKIKPGIFIAVVTSGKETLFTEKLIKKQ